MKKILNWIANLFNKTWHATLGLSLATLTYYFLYSLYHNCPVSFLDAELNILITISGIISGIIIAYLASISIQIKQENLQRIPDLKSLSKQVHRFRRIVHQLIHEHRFWPEGMVQYIEQEYPDLKHSDIVKITITDEYAPEAAGQFVNDPNFLRTKELYLELLEFEYEPYNDDTIYGEFEPDAVYPADKVNHWVKYDCSYGLYYYFDYRENEPTGNLQFHNVRNFASEAIKYNSTLIDNGRYGSLAFGRELLGKLGSQMHEDIMPRLQRTIREIVDIPKTFNFLYIFLTLFIVLGVFLPFSAKLFQLDINFVFTSFSSTSGLTLWFMLKFRSLLISDIRLVYGR